MLYAMPKPDAADLRVLDELGRMRSELRAHLRPAPRWAGPFRRSLFAAAIQGSNAIENITISNSDARALVEHAPMSAEAGEQTQQAVIGYRDAMTYVQQAPGSFQPERDAHSWLRFVFAAHHRQAQRVWRRYDWTLRLWNDLARLADETGLPERSVSALYAAAVRGPGRDPYPFTP